MKNKCKTTIFMAVIFIGGIVANANCQAQDQSTSEKRLYLIEEDWEMAINDPDVATHSPQVTFFTSPVATDGETYFQLQMNYHANQDFSGGGFHVGAFKAGSQVDEARSTTRIPLRVDGDRVRWTSIMATIDSRYYYAVNDGHGDDWGAFGGPDYLVSMPANESNNLDEYRHANSLEMVDVGFGGNRVSSIKLIRVRYFYSDGSRKTVQVHDATN